VRRREFILLLCGAAFWPSALRAQRFKPHVAVILVQHEGDLNAFLNAFEKLGWREGHNVRMDVRWAAGSAERMREISADFVARPPRR